MFARSVDGDLLPKHSILSACIAAPFVFIFGDLGFWIVQELLLLWLIYSSYQLVLVTSGVALPRTTVISICLFSQTLVASYHYSYDLHGCALIIGGLNLLRTRPAIGAAVMGFSVFIRPANLLLALPLALGGTTSGSKKEVFRSTIGLAVILFTWGMTNWLMWGNPLTTAYSRLPYFVAGVEQFQAHPLGFDIHTFLADWGGKLFGNHGLLPFNVALLALP